MSEYSDSALLLAALGGLVTRTDLDEGYREDAGKMNKAAVAAALAPREGGRGKLVEATGARGGLAVQVVLQRMRRQITGLGLEFQVAKDEATNHAPSLRVLDKIAPSFLELINRAGRYFDGREDLLADASVKVSREFDTICGELGAAIQKVSASTAKAIGHDKVDAACRAAQAQRLEAATWSA